jgi:ectoine hydroxylase-related dioxygenase (phytanoyl-CoA dioxygenase family)
MTTLPLQDLLPTDEDVAAYRRDGFHVAHDVIPAELLDTAERGMQRFYAGDHDAPFPGTTPYDHYDWKPEHGNTIRKNDYTSIQVRELAALTRSPVIGAIAAKLAGANQIRLWHDQLLYKPAGLDSAAGNVGWHTDRQYWQTCTSEAMLTGWVPFHDCDATVGGVTFVRGSHLWEQGRLDFWNTDLDALEGQFASQGRPVEKVTPVLPRGSMTFHHCRTIHGSGPNLSAAPRRSVAIHLQPGDNRYQPAPPLPDGTPQDHRNDHVVRLVDGTPDYADPRICPVVWPAQDEPG